METTDDLFLGDRLRILQPRRGFRAGLDSVMLAASLSARAGETLFEPGAGAGTASLCAAARLRDVEVVGLEIDGPTCDLAQENARRNGLDRRVAFHQGDIADPPRAVRTSFDQVFLNPPFKEPHEGNVAPDPHRARSRVGAEGGPDLAGWLELAVRRVRPRGRLTLIHRADKLDAILSALHGSVGMLMVLPLWPVAGREAKRVLVTGRRSVAGALRLLPGLVLHEADGTPTRALEAIARHGAGLDWEAGTAQPPAPDGP